MLIAHKIALNPNTAQCRYFAQGCGVARAAYNWALAEWQTQHKARTSDPTLPAPSDVTLRRQLNAIKREQFPWMFDVTKCAAQEAVIDLGVAFRNFFARRRNHPRFKKKGVHDSFCAANEAGTFCANSKRIKLPMIGWVRMRESVRFSGKMKRVTISQEAGRWFASVLVETDDIKPVSHPYAVVGVDLGVKALATLSNGEVIQGPKAHTTLLKRLRRSNKALARKRRGSKNFAKARRRLAKLHSHIANIRKDATHKLTTYLAKNFRVIGIEDLNVYSMSRNRRLARVILDGAFGMIRTQLNYKTAMYGSVLRVADRFYPSSKTCSCCGSVKKELALSQRVFVCEDCGSVKDRDRNASDNLELFAASFAVTACGEERSGAVRKSRVKRASVKQEENETQLAGAA